MAVAKDESWLFVAEWYDPMPQLKKKYLMKYFPKQHQVELVDLKSRKLFLKKSPCTPELSPAEFFVGGRVLVFSRELDIVDYGDESTRQKLSYQAQQAALLLSAGKDGDTTPFAVLVSNQLLQLFRCLSVMGQDY
jgi:nucleoside-diphosphate kinase